MITAAVGFVVMVVLCFLFVLLSHEASRSRLPRGGRYTGQWLK